MKLSVLRVMFSAMLSLCCAAHTVFAAPQAELWDRWQASDPAGIEAVDHGPWSRLLSKYVIDNHPSGVNRMAYSEVTPADKKVLDDYLGYLQGIAVSYLRRAEQLAYWVNLYNAFTVRLVVDRYPVASILKIKPGLIDKGPWDMKLMEVEQQRISLNDIEHRILRPIWQDNRIHYAVNCASIGCPNLQPEAFTADNMQRLLDKAAREYVNHPRGISVEAGRLRASQIYEWYQEDFGGSLESLIEHLLQYARPELAARLEGFRGEVSYAYDWDLNE